MEVLVAVGDLVVGMANERKSDGRTGGMEKDVEEMMFVAIHDGRIGYEEGKVWRYWWCAGQIMERLVTGRARCREISDGRDIRRRG